MRAAVGGGKSLIPSNAKVAVAGTPIDLPLGHRDEVWSIDHFDTVTVMIADAPRPDEIVLCMAVSDNGRPHPELAAARLQIEHQSPKGIVTRTGVSCRYLRLIDQKMRTCWSIPTYARRLERRHQGYEDTFFIEEVFVKIRGKQHYLWRAVDQDGKVVDVFLQTHRGRNAAKRFFRRLLTRYRDEPRKIVNDKLRSHSVAR